MTNISNTAAPAPAPISIEQLVLLCAALEKQNRELATAVVALDSAIDTYTARIAELHADHDKTKEQLQQVIKKDEMKTALLKQLIQKH
jgi:hypothetical protein